MANNYDSEALNEICSQIDLYEYASENYDFEKRGLDSYATHCPLHVDKTASLFITPSKNMFHCFSCGVGGNLVNWLMTFENLSFNEAVEKVGKLSGVDIKNLKQCESLKIFKSIRRITLKDNSKKITREILPETEIDKFSDEIPQEWVDEGINPDVMKIFNIRIDNEANRIIYPVYDKEFRLIGFKGRTRYENYKAIGIQKYMNYTKIGTTDFFIGMKEQYEKINQLKKVIIFEGIKSVMKAYDWGYDYTLAAETSCLNDEQIKILIQMGIKDITIAFDSDVDIKKIRESTTMLRKFANVFILRDRRFIRDRLLGEKEAPVDRGREIFETLLAERRKL